MATDTSALDAASASVPKGPPATEHKAPGVPDRVENPQPGTTISEYDAECQRRNG